MGRGHIAGDKAVGVKAPIGPLARPSQRMSSRPGLLPPSALRLPPFPNPQSLIPLLPLAPCVRLRRRGYWEVLQPRELASQALRRFAYAAERHASKLDYILAPKSIAVVGASTRPGTVGNDIFRNLLQAEFNGCVYPVNPKATNIVGVALLCEPGRHSRPGGHGRADRAGGRHVGGGGPGGGQGSQGRWWSSRPASRRRAPRAPTWRVSFATRCGPPAFL